MALALNEEIMQLVQGRQITDAMIGLPNPPEDLPPASRLGWYFGGYLSSLLSRDDCKRMVAVAKGITIGTMLVDMAPAVLLLS